MLAASVASSSARKVQYSGGSDVKSICRTAPVWGSLYDETRRNRYLAWAHPDDVAPVLNKDGWNDMIVRAVGPTIQIWVNGLQTVTYTESDHIPRSGAICLQIHSGAPAEAWHKDLALKEMD